MSSYPRKTVAAILATFAAGVATVLITTATITTANITNLVLGGGTSLDKHVRTTATVNPSALSYAGAGTSTVLTLTGASANDHCLVNVLSGDLDSTTSTAVLSCRTSTDSATVYYKNTSSTAFDAGSSVISVQAWSY